MKTEELAEILKEIKTLKAVNFEEFYEKSGFLIAEFSKLMPDLVIILPK